MEKKGIGTGLQVVIAEPIPAQQQRIRALLERDGIFSVRYVTHDGLDCLREVVSAQPDLVILNAVLDKIDGLEVLRRIREFALPATKCLFITTYRDYIAQYAILSGAAHCILAPYPDDILAQRARELVIPPKAAVPDAVIDACTAQLLRAIGAPENIKGYFYALDGIRILVRDPGLILRRRVTTELYGGIAKIRGVKPPQVERALRTLTDHIFGKSSLEALERYFNPTDIERSVITNSAFFSALAGEVTRMLQAPNSADGQALA